MEKKWTSNQAKIREILGNPDITSKDNTEYFAEWYPEALIIEAWKKDNGIIFYSLEHHDRETPIAIVLGFVTNDEIENYKA